MAAKKARKAKKARTKKLIVKAPTKRIKREIKSLRRGLKKEIALSKRVSKKASKKALKQGSELELLKRDIDKLKKRRKKASLSAYNRFMRAQIKKGISFKRAAQLWNRQKKADAKKNRRRTGYNAFVSIQLKQGKNMKQAIRAWNRLKNPKKKRARGKAKPKAVKKRRAVKKRKVVRKRRVAQKKRKIKRAKKKVAKRIVRKSAVVSKEALSGIIAGAFARVQQDAEKRESSINELFSKRAVSTTVTPHTESNEELALKMIDVYFREVARRGLKRSLSLDEVVNAYFYSLMRIQRKGIELQEICNIVNKSKFR